MDSLANTDLGCPGYIPSVSFYFLNTLLKSFRWQNCWSPHWWTFLWKSSVQWVASISDVHPWDRNLKGDNINILHKCKPGNMQEMQIKKVHQLEICNTKTARFRNSECSMLPPTSIKHRKSKKITFLWISKRQTMLVFCNNKKRLEGKLLTKMGFSKEQAL